MEVSSDFIRLLKFATYNAYTGCLIAGPPITESRFNWFKKISPGDLVMEVSSVYYEDRDQIRFGYLISDKFEPMFSEEQWEEVKEEYENERPSERIYRIRSLLTGEEVRWENCEFIRVPDKLNLVDLFAK